MNSRERVLRALERKQVDKVPHWIDFTSIEAQSKFFGEKFFDADSITQLTFQARFFDSDIVNLPIAGFPGCSDIFCQKLHEGEDYIISRNPFGGLQYWRKKPYFAKTLYSPVQTKEDLDRVAPLDLSQFEEKIHTLAQHARAIHERGYYTLAEIKGPFETPWMFLRGLVPYLKDLATDPDFITKMIEVSFKPMMELAEMVIDQAPFDGVWITDDLGERSYPFLSIEKYRRIYKPWHQQAINRLHKKGVKVSLHSDGNVMSLVGEFVDNKFDSLDPLEPADNMNLAELKAKYGDRITLMGGITRGIGTMTTEQIENHVQQVIRDGGPCGLILNCGGGIPPEMRLESLMSYRAAVEKHRKVLDS